MNHQKLEKKHITFYTRLSRRFILTKMSQLKTGYLHLQDGKQSWFFGDPISKAKATLKIHDTQLYGQWVNNHNIAFAETYCEGQWSTNNLTTLLTILADNIDVFEKWQSMRHAIMHFFGQISRQASSRSIQQAKSNIMQHYDLGNDFFRAWLDPTMMYSSAFFNHSDDTLENAQWSRLEMICQKLQLRPGHHLLEIGSGWGSLACYAAKHYGCHVTTTTISDAQWHYCQQMFKKEGLSKRITILNQDFRELDGVYDRIVSIEMIEAIGHDNIPVFFKQCHTLLKPDGMMLLQAITVKDQRYHFARKHTDFIKRYIFPGGHLPSITHMLGAMTDVSDMNMIDLHDLTPHYVKTLSIWQRQFTSSLQALLSMGYSETFLKRWKYYLAYCEAGFRTRATQVTQCLLAKPAWRFGGLHDTRVAEKRLMQSISE